MVKTQEQKLIRRKHKALENGHQTTLASICIDLGEFYDQEERYEDAIAEFQIVADIYKEMGKLLDYGRVCRGIGEAYINLQDYEKALEYQQTYLEIAKEQGNKLEEQRALATIGHIHLTRYLNEVDNPNQHTLHSASKAFKKSLTICESLTDVKKHEHKDMITRLLANLGVVYECEGKYEKAEELLRKSIDICKTHDLFEQLQRGYTCLGTLYVRKKQYDEAIRQYNLAMEVAGRLKNKAQLVSAALQSKADILIKMADFYGARTQLLKAYKLEQSNADDRRVIEQNLKIVAAMCKVEESLLTTDNRDYVTKKNLYEKLGDGASHLKNFSYAIDCYQKMLEAATNNKDTGSQLSPCYISLAETYRDDKQYENAVKYFREDYNNSDVPREQVATLLSIADCMDAGEYDSNEIVGVYDEAHGMCRVIGDGRLSFKVLASYAAFLKRHRMHENAVKIEQHLNAINGADVDTDSEAADAVLTPNLGDDISIKDITDISDDSDTENRTTRRRTKGYVVKRNNKGETQLHTACIHGNFELVKRLITQRHPVNIRDNCGWLPIHEACICGQLEIVRLLIDNGASINDRGGTLCEGTSPLHDAALNGHLEVVQLLLDSGASSIAKNDSGQIPLQVLKAWRAGRQLDDTQEALYNGLVRRLSGEAGKLGLPEESVDLSESSAFVANCSDEEEGVVPAQRKLRDRRCSQVGNLRRNVGCDEDLDRARKKRHSTESSTSAKDEYRKVMEQMRHPTREKSGDRKRKSTENIKQSVYVEGDDDNWLENDVASTSKKRKTTSATFRRHSSASAASLKSVNSVVDNDDDVLEQFFNSEDDAPPPTFNTSQKKARKRQTSLLDSGFTRHASFESTRSARSISSSPAKASVYSDTYRDASFNVGDINSVFNSEPTLSVDVRINGKLYKVPVPASEIHTRTIKWLADEASLRFSRKECMKPDLELETKNGAVLADDDFISVLFSAGLSHAEEVEARITKWNLLPLSERYAEACAVETIAPSDELMKILETVSISLSLANLNLGDRKISPLCRVINRQLNLHSLNLSGNFIHDDCFQVLCTSLPTLENLCDLNLSLNQLTCVSLRYLTEVFTQTPTPVLANLTKLDLSHNPLGNESLNFLSVITRHLKLKTLNLADVDFTGGLFASEQQADLNLDSVSNFDVGYNRLGNDEIATFLSWLKPQNIESLNLGDCSEIGEGLVKSVVEWMQTRGNTGLPLKVLNLSRTCATDNEIFELLRYLTIASQLFSINLSYNASLTTPSLRRVLESCPTVTHLNLTGCDNIVKNLECCTEEFWNGVRLRELKLSGDFEKYARAKETVVNMWKSIHNGGARVLQLRNFLHFSLVK
uniref:Tonsoku-like protein n=2 Tax=Photinus pyralis TaxID=7054 RepID=A0A1Y1NAZ6_PHOPY